MNPLQLIESGFQDLADTERAEKMAAYMKDRFPFFGIMATERTEFLKSLLSTKKIQLQSADELKQIVLQLWERDEREFQYAALYLLERYKKWAKSFESAFYESLIVHKSWWDTVDSLASNFVGAIWLGQTPIRDHYTDIWLQSGNMWLQRTCIIHQLKYKEKTDLEYLDAVIQPFIQSKEFFLQKAIGWSLRQVAYHDADWVRAFVENNPLPALSKREALKHFR